MMNHKTNNKEYYKFGNSNLSRYYHGLSTNFIYDIIKHFLILTQSRYDDSLFLTIH